MRWTPEALAAAGSTEWHDFHDRYPQFSYDAWEVKRRRVEKAPAVNPEPADLERLRELAGQLRPDIAYRIVGGKVEVEDRPTERDQTVRLDIGSRRVRLAIASDSHGGSHFEQLGGLRRFYEYADRLNVDAFVHVGDWTQGSDRMHLDQAYQVHVHGADQQVAYVAATYPKSSRDIPTYGISGNHDDSFLKDGGINVLRRLAELRDDIVYLGQTACYLSVGSLNMYLVHPRGGGAYAKSYKLQKYAEALPIGREVHLLLMGHLHSYAVSQEHGMTAMLLSSFQSQYGWLASGGLHPAIGGLIVDAWMTKAGEIGRIRHEFVRFQAQANDWDHDASRAAVETWSNEGLAR